MYIHMYIYVYMNTYVFTYNIHRVCPFQIGCVFKQYPKLYFAGRYGATSCYTIYSPPCFAFYVNCGNSCV